MEVINKTVIEYALIPVMDFDLSVLSSAIEFFEPLF